VSAPQPDGHWGNAAEQVVAVLNDRFGGPPARASISFLGVEPMEILRYRTESSTVFCSLGMARSPMTPADESLVDVGGPRAELLVEITSPEADSGQAEVDEVWRALAIFAAAPSVEGVVYAPGTTVDSGRVLVRGSRCTGGLVLESGIPDVVTGLGLVTVLRLVPATADELAWARVHGARELQGRFDQQGTDTGDLLRGQVDLG
jgi:hypothetical protein